MKGQKGAGYAGNALSDHLSEIHGVGQELCLTDRWPFLWRDIRFVYRPCVSRSRQWWVDWFGTRWRFINIDIPNRGIVLDVSEAELAARRETEEAHGDAAWSPKGRERQVSYALRAYAMLATSADKGAVRDKSKLGG